MSLFGGDSSGPPSQSPYESESDFPPPSPARSQPYITAPASFQNAQNTLAHPVSSNSDADDDLLTESEPETDESADEQPIRSDRFAGHPQTWRGLTAADRQIVASLDHTRDADLAAHLYNAHALKRRVRRPARETSTLKSWQGKHFWLEDSQTELVPSKDWTAWPLPPTQTQDVEDELRDETLATFLRLAKERWSLRHLDNDTPSDSRSDFKLKNDDTLVPDNVESQKTDNEPNVAKHSLGKKRGRKPQAGSITKPIVLSDDAQADRILRPTISSILNNVDELALAVRRTRFNHYGRGAYSDQSSQGDFTSDAEPTGPGSGSSSVAGSNSRPRQKPMIQSKSRKKPKRTGSASQTGQMSTNNRSDLSNSDSGSDVSQGFSHAGKRSRSGSEDSASTSRDWSAPAGLIDWSEVLGIAATKGWNERALLRTAQRCAALFEESMSFVSFDENLASHPTHYTPSTILPSGGSSISTPLPLKRPLFQVGTLHCPHTDCWGHEQAFAIPYRVIEHCMRVHGYDPRDNDITNENRTVGGVHIDGFLQPVTVKPGWLGHGRSKAGGEKSLELDLEGKQGEDKT